MIQFVNLCFLPNKQWKQSCTLLHSTYFNLSKHESKLHQVESFTSFACNHCCFWWGMNALECVSMAMYASKLHEDASFTSFTPTFATSRALSNLLNPIPVGGRDARHPPYSFIVLTHIKVKQMTSNPSTIPLWQ